MKQKIKEALEQGYKNLGLSGEAFERVAAFGETFIKEEAQIATFVQGAEAILKAEQSAADKVRTELNAKIKGLEGEKSALEAKLNGNNQSQQQQSQSQQQPTEHPQDMAKIIAEAVAAAIKPISDDLADFKAEKTINDTVATVNSRIDAWGYGKGYPKEMEKARKNAMELYEAYGKKWTPDQLEAKIKEKFNMEVHDKGVDTSKPFESDGGGSRTNADFSGLKQRLQEKGMLPNESKN